MTFHPLKRCYVRDPALRTMRFIIWYVIAGVLLGFAEWLIVGRG